VAKFIQLLLSGEPITIYGDGSQTRDFVFVDDIVSAVVSAMERDVGGETFQIATGRETSIRALIALLAAVTETEPEVEWLPQLPGEIRRSYASIARARARLGFEPGIALEDGLRMTYAWLAERNAPAR
jgi:UDP-glucose 4-epimerase